MMRDGKGHPATQKAFLYPNLKFYLNLLFFHNSISLNSSSVTPLSQKTRLKFLLPQVVRETLKTSYSPHSRLL
jgi:hypothetical protein